MIYGSEKRNRQLAFELQNSHVCEKRSNVWKISQRNKLNRKACTRICRPFFLAPLCRSNRFAGPYITSTKTNDFLKIRLF